MLHQRKIPLPLQAVLMETEDRKCRCVVQTVNADWNEKERPTLQLVLQNVPSPTA